MTSSDQNDNDSSRSDITRNEREYEDNPFIAFRRFADEQMASLLDALNELPSILTSARERFEEQRRTSWKEASEKSRDEVGQHREEREKGVESLRGNLERPKVVQDGADGRMKRTDNSQRRRGRNDDVTKVWDFDHGTWRQLPTEQAKDAATEQHPVKPTTTMPETGRRSVGSPHANATVDQSKVQSLWQDDNDRGPLWGSPQWLSMSYFARSPYSPLQLERHPNLSKAGAKWRAAFEDLMNAHLGKEMTAWDTLHGDRDDETMRQEWSAGALAWPFGMVNRGVIPVPPGGLPERHIMPSFFNPGLLAMLEDETEGFERFPSPMAATTNAERPSVDANFYRPATELDLYEHFLGRASDDGTLRASGVDTSRSSTSTSRTQTTSAFTQSSGSIDEDSTKPSVLSTMTTTERTMLPDGTVTTKVMLKKRFADGREESSETVSTVKGRGEAGDRFNDTRSDTADTGSTTDSREVQDKRAMETVTSAEFKRIAIKLHSSLSTVAVLSAPSASSLSASPPKRHRWYEQSANRGSDSMYSNEAFEW
ncbi:hypothetical protein LTR50_005084 [Elasticomyces elasticus]|nr:hypothetical protein LTR50_005084 [Elasticomyces elasticus]